MTAKDGKDYCRAILTTDQMEKLESNFPEADWGEFGEQLSKLGTGLVAALRALGILALLLFLMSGLASAQDKAPAKKDDKKTYHTGRVEPKNLAAIKAAARKRNGWLHFPKTTAPTWDCRQLGIVPPVVDQGNCGSCWDFSGTSICTSALIKAGYGKADGSFALSEQYTLDCGQNGGCNGDDNTTVTAWCKSTGLPLSSDYGPYQARPGRCKSGTKLYKISDWGFCDGGQGNGVTDTQLIKNAMVQYGPIGAAIAADNAFMNVQPGQVFSGNARDINHDIVLVGWDDTKGKSGAWLLRNSWGTGWCDNGYCWIEYGANSVGTEAIWATASPLPLPPLPPGPPPGPTPVPPPGPAPGPVPVYPTVNIPLTNDQVASVLQQLQQPGSGIAVIRGDMTLNELMDALGRATNKKQCCGNNEEPGDMDDIKAIVKLLATRLKALESRK